MPPNKDDWRLQGQEKYLQGATLHYKAYKDRSTKTDHDHCEFCQTKFTEAQPETLHQGYTTPDHQRWICAECFQDFSVQFQFKLIKDK